MYLVIIKRILIDILLGLAVVPYILFIYGIQPSIQGVFIVITMSLVFSLFYLMMHQYDLRVTKDNTTGICRLLGHDEVYYEIINSVAIGKDGDPLWLDGTGVPTGTKVKIIRLAGHLFLTDTEFSRLLGIQQARLALIREQSIGKVH